MNTVIAERVSRQHVENLRRLANKAERSGTRVLRIAGSDRHVATSGTHPVAYEVSVEGGCSCRGYSVWHRCGHHALLLSELGMIPDLAPAATATCPACDGSGVDPDCHGHQVASGSVSCPCDACQGTGTVEVDVVIAERPALVA